MSGAAKPVLIRSAFAILDKTFSIGLENLVTVVGEEIMFGCNLSLVSSTREIAINSLSIHGFLI